jgi:hypothetical protein
MDGIFRKVDLRSLLRAGVRNLIPSGEFILVFATHRQGSESQMDVGIASSRYFLPAESRRACVCGGTAVPALARRQQGRRLMM